MRIIFICYDASISGVPLLSLQLVRWLKVNHNVEPFIILLHGGVLENEFRKEGEVFVWNKTKANGEQYGQIRRLLTRVGNLGFKILRDYRLKKKIQNFRADTIYINTVAVLKFLHDSIHLFKHQRKILHCHEMEYSIKHYVPDSVEYLFASMDRIVTVNENIRQYFLSKGIATQKLLRVPEYLVNDFASPAPRRDHDIFKVVGAGLGCWRKGIDLFILSAFYFSKIYDKPFYFTWVGKIQESLVRQLAYDIKQLGLVDHVSLVGELSDIGEHINNSDIFFLSSREDPYPLVMLEAAWFEKPILYFENTGGASEFVNDKQLAVKAFDVFEAANRLLFYAENAQIRTDKGQMLKTRVSTHTIENVGKTIFEFIQIK